MNTFTEHWLGKKKQNNNKTKDKTYE